VLEWLLEPSNPSVRFWTLQHLDGLERDDPEVEGTQESIMDSYCIKKILEKQSKEGFWENPTNLWSPSYTATVYTLYVLAELGAKRTPAIEKSIEHTFLYQRVSGHFLPELPKGKTGRASTRKDYCCLDAMILFYLIHFGYFEDEHVRHLIDFLVEIHDMRVGGWQCRIYPSDPDKVFPVNCFMGAAKILKSFAVIPEDHRHVVNSIIEKVTENILENRVYKYLMRDDGSRKDKAGWKRFGFPLFYQSDVLEVLDTLTSLGIKDQRMQDAISLVEDTEQSDGKWLLRNSYNGKMWCDIEKKENPLNGSLYVHFVS
jgi:hypothetical protein